MKTDALRGHSIDERHMGNSITWPDLGLFADPPRVGTVTGTGENSGPSPITGDELAEIQRAIDTVRANRKEAKEAAEHVLSTGR